jgi:hypothetical protein
VTACRPVLLKTLGCDCDSDSNGEGSFFAISNELHGFCHTAVQIEAVMLKILMFLVPLVMAMTVMILAAAVTTKMMIVYMLASDDRARHLEQQ